MSMAECCDCGAILPCHEGQCPHIPPEVLALWVKQCKCCGECSPVVCGGVQQGGFCERVCRCHDEGEDWPDYDDLPEEE